MFFGNRNKDEKIISLENEIIQLKEELLKKDEKIKQIEE